MGVSLRNFRLLALSKKYCHRHRKSETDFTRERKLSFVSLLQFLLCKSVKSLQLRLNEWAELLDGGLSASALTQARSKLRHTAFVELLEQCVIKVVYGDGDYERFKGYRLVAVDGSTLRLPRSSETLEHYGQSRKGDEKLVEGKLSVVYDLLNRIPLSAILHPGRTNDIVACKEQLPLLNSEDILIADRGYDSYEFFADILNKKAHFVVRCQATRTVCKELIENNKSRDITVQLALPKTKVSCKETLPQSLTVRFVRIPLSNGEVEILATSLLDRKKFDYKEFKKLYAKRWKVETYFQILKSRLGLDNFSGKTKEAILQDLHATIFVSGLSTLLTEGATEELNKKEGVFPQQVNNAVVFHAIKNKVIALMFEGPPDFEEQVKALFIKNPTLVRDQRHKERIYNFKTASGKTRSLFFQKHQRKHVF